MKIPDTQSPPPPDTNEYRGPRLDASARSVPKAPWYVEREDDEDGSINYHVWSKEPVTWLFTVYGRDHINAKAIAEMGVTAINTSIRF